ncbi:hypothetical protein C0992_000319 [Termitomyces sp. T32_za158]|nr:hypothetical protein C0992_000319 [Termitomyces sp. T32_za158]
MSNEPSSSKLQLPSLASQRGQQPSLVLQREQQQGAFAPIIERLNAPSGVEHRPLANRLSSPSPSQDDEDGHSTPFQNQADECQRIIDETIEGTRSFDSFFQALRRLGLNSAEAKDHVDEVIQRIELRRRAKGKRKETKSRELSPNREGSTIPRDDQNATLSDVERGRHEQRQAVESAAWSSLRAKCRHLEDPSNSPAAVATNQIAEILGPSGTSSCVSDIPQSVLAAVPHLAQLQSKVSADPHVAETWRLRQEYAKELALDPLIRLGQTQRLLEPISRAMWKLIILDHYVDFDKLYATLAKGYDQHDDPKDFAAGFSLVKKDVATAKRPVRSESDWMRVFDAWAEAVCVFYPHREHELSLYRAKIVDFCCNIPNGAAIAIQFDCDARDRYSRNPFRMDDPNELQNPFLAQVLTVSSHPQAGSKRGPSASSQPRKRIAAICHNWNLGFCNADLCPGNRRHNVCSECRGNHRARDVEECHSKLKLRRQQYRSTTGLDA